MERLTQLTERLANTVLMTDPQDLPAMAKLHEQLEGLRGEVKPGEGLEAKQASHIQASAEAASHLVEQVILREVTDVSGALESVCRSVCEIQQILTGTWAPGSQGSCESPSGENAKSEVKSAPTSAAKEADALPKAEDLPLVRDFIAEARSHLEAAEADLLKLEEQPEDHELINSVFRAFHTIKGVAGFLNFKQIGELAHAAENVLDRGRKGELTLTSEVLDLILQSGDMAKALLCDIEVAAENGTCIPVHAGLPEFLARLRAGASGKSEVAKAAGEAAASSASPTTEPPSGAASVDGPTAGAAAGTGKAVAAADATVKVSTGRLDSLINMVGELVIAQAMVSQDTAKLVNGDQRVARNLTHLGKITRELQDLTMAMRMVPIQGVFQKMARLVRDLARKAGKQIDLKLTGGETELDRNLVEAIGDPLVHMVRNAADHGVESPEDRLKAGKSPVGRVELKAYHQAGSIVVEITDDGRGLDKARILAKAKQNGLVKEGEELSEQEIFRLIFAPGLSTAEKVTDVSGRGVGMDVVRRNVENLRGRIDITSTPGHGSTFAIRLPLTLAVIDGLVVKVGEQRYILPITSIEQSLRPKPEQISTVQNRGEMCMIRGSLLPICRLHKLFNVTPRTTNPCEALLVLVQDGSRRCGLLVDELLGQQQVVIKALGESVSNLQGVSGGAILGDGTISLILDVPGLMELATTT